MRRLTDASFVQSAACVADSAWKLNSPRSAGRLRALIATTAWLSLWRTTVVCTNQGEHLLSARARSLRGCLAGQWSLWMWPNKPVRNHVLRHLLASQMCVFLEGKGATFTITLAHLSTPPRGYFSTARNWVTSASRATGLPQMQKGNNHCSVRRKDFFCYLLRRIVFQ